MHILIKIIAQFFIIIPVACTASMLFRLRKGPWPALVVKLLAGGILSLLLAMAASKFIHDPRPFVSGHFKPLIPHANDNGFPSDHTLLAAFLGWVLLGYSRKLGYAVLAVAALVGLARMAAGIHHSWDVIGSFIISGAAAYVAGLLVPILPTSLRSAARKNDTDAN